jgi:hypothetical protein
MWSYDTCALCKGKGKINRVQVCPVCKGEGLWEFVDEDNAKAVHSLLSGEAPENERVKRICEHRLASLTPDNFQDVIKAHDQPGNESDFNTLHQAGAKAYGWAWLHTNRFAIELLRLCGGDPTDHRLAMTRLSLEWLLQENQKKIDAPIDRLK